MKRISLSLILLISFLINFNSYAYEYYSQSSVVYNGGYSYADPFQNYYYQNNYIAESNAITNKTPAIIKVNNVAIDNYNPQYIIGGPLSFINSSKYEIILNDGTNQLWNRVKFHYNLSKTNISNLDTMVVKLNGVPIVNESFQNQPLDEDYYIWIYKSGNITIEFNSWNLQNNNIGQSLLTLSNIEVYNG